MTRPTTFRRLATVAIATIAAAALAACSNPTAPSQDDGGIYGGTSTKAAHSICGGIYGGTSTC